MSEFVEYASYDNLANTYPEYSNALDKEKRESNTSDWNKSDETHTNVIESMQRYLRGSTAIRGMIDLSTNNLERFLRARKFAPQKAIELIVNYYRFKELNPEMFQVDRNVEMALLDGLPTILTNRDRKGRKILLMSASNYNQTEANGNQGGSLSLKPLSQSSYQSTTYQKVSTFDSNAYNIVDIYRATILSLERLTQHVHNQICGFVIIIDWNGFTLRDATNLTNTKFLKLMVDGLQECFPAKFKGIHFISQPWYVATTLSIVKPFLKEKTRNRIHLHGTNLATLHEHIPIDVLPPELGGEGTVVEPNQWLKEIKGQI